MTNKLCSAPVVLLLLGCQPLQENEASFRTAVVEERDIVVVVESAGIVRPHSTVEVKSKASGEILSIEAETGDFIEEGTLLVQIDKRSPRNQLELVEAQREAALARRAIAEAQHERAKRLYKSRSINEVDYEETVLKLAESKSQVVQSQVSIETARFALEDTVVSAPITGTVIEKLVERGQVISSPMSASGEGNVLLKMADLRTMQVQALVNEIDIGKIQRGQSVLVRVTSYPNKPFHGEVVKIEPQAMAEQAVTSFPVLITLDNRGGLLRPGMNADVEIFVENRRQVVALPNAALRTSRDIETTAALVGIAESEIREKLAQQERETQSSASSPHASADSPSTTQIVSENRFWVLVDKGGSFEPVYVEAGSTDLDFSEVLSGIDVGAKVLLLPSSGMVKSQQQLVEHLSSTSRIAGLMRRSD